MIVQRFPEPARAGLTKCCAFARRNTSYMKKILSVEGLGWKIGEGGILDIVLDTDFVPLDGKRLLPATEPLLTLKVHLINGVVCISRPVVSHRRNPLVRLQVTERGSDAIGHPHDSEMSLGLRDLPVPLEVLGLSGGRVELKLRDKQPSLTLSARGNVVELRWSARR
jgi:hypothetical protein